MTESSERLAHASRVTIRDHPTVLLPVHRGSADSTVCKPHWWAWLDWEPLDRPPNQSADPNAAMSFDLRWLGAAEQHLGRGQCVNLKANSPIPTVTSLVLTIGDYHVEGYTAHVKTAYIKSKSRVIVVPDKGSVFKLIGQDKDGNQFNTLDGGNVTWSFNETLLETIPIPASEYKLKYLFWDYEDIVIVKAIEEGETDLTGTMQCTGVSFTINLSIVRPIKFQPDRYKIYPGEETNLRLYKGKQNVTNGVKIITVNESLPVTGQNSPQIAFHRAPESPSILTFDQSQLRVKGLKPGVITITASHRKHPKDSSAQAVVTVRYPKCKLCGEQVVLYNDGGPRAVDGPYAFDMSRVSLGKKDAGDGKCTNPPANVTLTASTEWMTPGSHNVTVRVGGWDDYSIACPVVTLIRPYYEINHTKVTEVTILLGCVIELTTFVSSGNARIVSPDSSNIIEIEALFPIIRVKGLAVGDQNVEVAGDDFPSWTGILKVHVCSVTSVVIRLPRTEARVGDVLPVNLDVSSQCQYSKACSPERALRIVETDSERDSDVFQVLENGTIQALRPGWARVYGSAGGQQSRMVLVHAFDKLEVDNHIGLPPGWNKIERRGGPDGWPKTGQTARVVSCTPSVPFDQKDDLIRFNKSYKGVCNFTVKNDRTQDNPDPVPESAPFQVSTQAVASLNVILYDELSEDLTWRYREAGFDISGPHECRGYVPFAQSNVLVRELSIAYSHTVVITILALDETHTPVGRFQASNYQIVIRDTKRGNSSTHTLTDNRVTIFSGPLHITAVSLEPNLPVPTIHPVVINVVTNHSVSGPHGKPIWYHDPPHSFDIRDGSGNFSVLNSTLQLTGRTVKVPQSKPDTDQAVIVKDQCIPENVAEFNVQTRWPVQVTLDGPIVGRTGERLQFRTIVTDSLGETFKVAEYPKMKTTQSATLPAGGQVTFGPEPNDRSLYSLKAPAPPPGESSVVIHLEATFDDITGSHDVTIFSDPVCTRLGSSEELWVGQTVKFGLAPSTCSISNFHSNSSAVSAWTVGQSGLEAKTTAGGSFAIDVVLDCSGITLPVPCRFSVAQFYDMALNITPARSPYVGSYVIVKAQLRTSLGMRTPSAVEWTAVGPASSLPLFDKSLVLHGRAPGTVTVTAKVPEPVAPATRAIVFDPKLEVLTRDLLLPVGTTFQLQIADNLPVTYETRDPAVQVSPTGVVSAVSVGVGGVLVRYKTQVSIVTIDVTPPDALYFEHAQGDDAITRLLNQDGQQYSGRTGSTVAFDPALAYKEKGDLYSFTVTQSPTIVRGSVTAGRVTQSHSVMLRSGIVPASSALHRGHGLALSCHVAGPSWSTSNQDVAIVSDTGYVRTRHVGHATVNCAAEVASEITVFELVELALEYINETAYWVRPLLFSTDYIEKEYTQTLPPGVKYSCHWDAVECGTAEYRNNTCVLTILTPRLCPVISKLTVKAEDAAINLFVNGSTGVVHPNPWGQAVVNVSLKPFESLAIPLCGKVRQEDVRGVDQPPKGVEWKIEKSQPGCLRLSLNAVNGYTGQTQLTLIDGASDEKIRIVIAHEKIEKSGDTAPPEEGWGLLYAVILLIGLVLYIGLRLSGMRFGGLN